MATSQRTFSWILSRGARPEDSGVQFEVWAPRARRVRVRVLTGAARGDHPLYDVNEIAGCHAGHVEGASAGDEYTFILDDERSLPDPVSRWQPCGVHGPSRVVDPSGFLWTDEGWRGTALSDAVIYELHVGTFTPEGTFEAVIPRLARLRELGVTAIELMPVAQFPGARNWGYDGVALYAVQNTYGGPNGLKSLVDAAHAVGLGVILDVVYNHLGPEGNYLDAYGPYFTEKYSTPWGRALNYDDAESEEVRRFVIENARYWLSEYHVDGLRLDAVHGIYDFSARHLLEELAADVHAHAASLGKNVIVVAESDLNDPKLVRPVEQHGYGLDGQWADDFHHAVHALLTGERSGYYADFGRIDQLADALRKPFVFDGVYSVHRRRRHGRPAADIPRGRFVVATQNHDQVGNRATGERLCTLIDAARTRLAAALLLTSPYVPLIFMGEEYGETNPFQYFVDHGDSTLLEAVRTGRRREFAGFGWGDEVPDPAAVETFDRSKLDWGKRDRDSHARILALYRELLRARREEPLLQPDAAAMSVEVGERGWITTLRTANQRSAVVCVYNCSDRLQQVPFPATTARAWTLRLSTDAAEYGGEDRIPHEFVSQRDVESPERPIVSMPPWSAAIYRQSA
ncbi:MAG TPA: malto-oligosyltrehalose trehalohydrolase [Gemmatimonadaceae bacterium]|nr:malto-oligosyltrehalose trehalohydrolase [Gemmatimonadaceae bacterium]